MKVGILGSGDVAKALAKGFDQHGYEVFMGSRDSAKLADFAQAHGGIKTGSFAQAAAFGEVLVLAVKGLHAQAALALAEVKGMAGKVIIDATNPIADAPPVNGVLQYFTGPNESLGERLQRAFPQQHFVKAFSCVGNVFMVNPAFPDGKPTMFIAGNDFDAKATVNDILQTFGWEVADMGAIEASRAIEPLAMLWCIPGFLRNDWQRAFKMLRMS